MIDNKTPNLNMTPSHTEKFTGHKVHFKDSSNKHRFLKISVKIWTINGNDNLQQKKTRDAKNNNNHLYLCNQRFFYQYQSEGRQRISYPTNSSDLINATRIRNDKGPLPLIRL